MKVWFQGWPQAVIFLWAIPWGLQGSLTSWDSPSPFFYPEGMLDPHEGLNRKLLYSMSDSVTCPMQAPRKLKDSPSILSPRDALVMKGEVRE